MLPLRQVDGSITPVGRLGHAVCADANRYFHLPLRAGDLLVLWYHVVVFHTSSTYSNQVKHHQYPRLYVPQFAIDPAMEEGIPAAGSVADGSARSMLAPDPFALYTLCPAEHGRLRIAVMHTRSTVALEHGAA